MPVHQVPNTHGGVRILAEQVLPALQAGVVNLTYNDAATVAASLYDLIGLPGAGMSAGKQGQLALKRDALTAAGVARRAAIDAARAFNAAAIHHLKAFLGHKWNPRWQAAGFTQGTLQAPRNPLLLLPELRAYFLAHAAHENAATQLTAAKADALAAAINDAVFDENVARTERNTAADLRDASFVNLRLQMVGVRRELGEVLPDDDQRWLSFGFSRPVDRRAPQPVTGLLLRPGGLVGEIIVEWEASVGASNYRVSRQVLTVDPEPMEVGLFNDRLVAIAGLPSGKTVLVSLTARNEAGESLPVSSSIVVA